MCDVAQFTVVGVSGRSLAVLEHVLPPRRLADVHVPIPPPYMRDGYAMAQVKRCLSAFQNIATVSSDITYTSYIVQNY